jgi:hypothetical protein
MLVMRKSYLTVFIFCTTFLFSCLGHKKYFLTLPECDDKPNEKVYVEEWDVCLWPIEKNKRAYYLTDSVNFRINIGTFHKEQVLVFLCNGDSILASDFFDLVTPPTFSHSYSLKELRKSKVFDKP